MTASRRTPRQLLRFLGIAALAAACARPAAARVLQVGAGQTYASPSAAAAVARDGDTIAIFPGTYYDCAAWRANRLVIAATAPEAVVSDLACAGKAAFVISGNGVVVRGLVFTRIRVPDGNGAGIRLEGHDLTVEDSRFINDQVGILAAEPGGTLRIDGCVFSGNGDSPEGRPTHGVLAGHLDRLRIEHSVFRKARGGDHVSSSALDTALVGNRLIDEGGAMAGPLVTVRGGRLTLDGNTVELDAGSAKRPGAVLVTGEASRITVDGNTLIEPRGKVPLLRDWTGVAASAADNTVPVNAVAVSDSGATYHRLRAQMALLRDQAHSIAGSARRRVAAVARGLRLIP